MSDEDKKTPLAKAFDTDDIFGSKDLEIMPPERDAIGTEDPAEEDYRTARENIHDVLDKANVMLDNLSDFAEAAQTARAYEVYSTMVKTIIDGNKDLLELAKKRKELGNMIEGSSSEGGKVVNNTLVVGTTEELQKYLRQEGIVTNTRIIGMNKNNE